MKCPKCNEEIADVAKFCTKCGVNIEEEKARIAEENERKQKEEEARKKEIEDRKKLEEIRKQEELKREEEIKEAEKEEAAADKAAQKRSPGRPRKSSLEKAKDSFLSSLFRTSSL